MTIADWIILLFASLLASTISGIAGFGGALLLLPVVSKIVGIEAAIPILTIGQLFGNASRVVFNWRELKWKPVSLFLITAIPFTIAGSYLFYLINANKLKAIVGVFLIILVIYRRTPKSNKQIGTSGTLLGGGITGFISGIAGSAGPLGAAIFLGMGLAPAAYIASEAFTALSMHIVKSVMYNRLAQLGSKELTIGLIVGAVMILGSWLGKHIFPRFSKKNFILVLDLLLVISGLYMILDILI
ncbi:MAG: sulfite exporter TauE/SafE family protein [Sphingobacteriia bacterium]|nr:sulfite exporter TauE/SafE family protein [Sphingobacteriia bacterium]